MSHQHGGKKHGHPSHDHEHHGQPGHHGDHRDHLGNPEDLASYLDRLEGADRAAWQMPDAVVTALRLRDGARVCEVGPGPGYFTLRLARAVGPTGRVIAIEAEPRMIEILRTRLRDAHIHNVDVVEATGGEALPAEPVDCVFVLNTFHHFARGVEYMRALAAKLAPGGTFVNIDFHAGECPVGPPPDHKISRERFLELAREAGLDLVREERFLPYQYFVVLAVRRT